MDIKVTLKEVHNEVVKLHSSISKYSSSELAEKIAFGTVLRPSASDHEKKEWVNYVTAELEREFDDQTIKEIRYHCFCNEEGKLEESRKFINSIYQASTSMEQFVDRMNDFGVGWYVKDGSLHTRYFSCSCPMLAGVDALPTKTWCYCTVGYNKAIFEDVFQCKVDVELLESVKLGYEHCLMKIVPRSAITQWEVANGTA